MRNVVQLPALLAYTQGLGLERFLARTKGGLSSLSLALLWLVLTGRSDGAGTSFGATSDCGTMPRNRRGLWTHNVLG